MTRFRDRADAGRQLAGRLAEYRGRPDVLVLALPRGGVPVAAEVARQLSAPLDLFLVRKLGVPGHPELAMGAIAEGGVRVLSDNVIRELGIPTTAIEHVAMEETQELNRRERHYRGERQAPSVQGKTVIVIDDGLATGATMEAAVLALRQLGPAHIIAAAPVGAPETCARLQRVADTVVCLETPSWFSAVGLWYDDFSQTTDEEVRDLLARPKAPPGLESPGLRRSSRSDPLEAIREHAIRLRGETSDYDPLIDAIGEAQVVLLGEATHGTHEFYCERAAITRRLIAEKHFSAVAVEADWPDAYRVNRFVRGIDGDEDSVDALADFGVLYLPDTERRSHYFNARLSEQFDDVLHFDETRAVEPLERTATWVPEETAETYPSGL